MSNRLLDMFRAAIEGREHERQPGATRLLARLKEEGRLQQQGERRGAFYTVGENGRL